MSINGVIGCNDGTTEVNFEDISDEILNLLYTKKIGEAYPEVMEKSYGNSFSWRTVAHGDK